MIVEGAGRSQSLRSRTWILIGLLMIAAAQSASAHPVLTRSVPASGDTLRQSPGRLTLLFSKSIEVSLSTVELVGLDGRVRAIGPLESTGTVGFTTTFGSPLAPGTYEVRWKTAGADGHPVRGRYSFVVARRPASPSGAPDLVTPDHHPAATFPQQVQGFGVEGPTYAAIRAITYAVLITLLGVVAFQLLVLPKACRRLFPGGGALCDTVMRRSTALGITAATALVLASIGRLAAQVYAMLEPGIPPDWDMVSAAIMGSTWGMGWLLQIVGGLTAVMAFWLAWRGAAWALAAAYVAVFAVAFFPAMSGHAAAIEGFSVLPIVADGVHVLSAGGWLGTLLVMMLVGIPTAIASDSVNPGRSVAALVNAFSPAALAFAGLAVVTGVFAAWLHVGNLPALWTSGYGRTLLLKLGVVSLVALTGAYNWRRVRPSLGSEEATRRLKVSATTELIIATVVIAITAVLVATPPPMEP